MLEEFRLAFALHRAEDVTASPETAWAWLGTGWDLVPEAADDRVTWSYQPMAPWHLAYTSWATVRPLQVEVGDQVVLNEHGPTRVDAGEIRARSRKEARRLFARMERL